MMQHEARGTASKGQAGNILRGPTVYFDGSCALCTAEIGHYASRKGGDEIGFVDVSEAGVNLGSDLSGGDAMARFHVRLADGTLVSGAPAFVAVWEALPGWRWAARVAKLPGVMTVLEVLYRGFLPIRPYLSKLAGRIAKKPAGGTR